MRKWECTVCGYIHEGDEPPDECPVCSADKSMFVEIFDEAPASPSPGSTVPEPEKPTPAAAPTTFLISAYAFAQQQIVQHHLHPIAVHTPNGILPMSLVFFLLAALLGQPLFESAAFFSLIFVLIAMPAVLFTGYVAWQKLYRGAMTPIFKIKIAASILTMLLLTILCIWRAVQPDIITTASNGRWLFLGLALVLVSAVGIAGHMGGKLVFGGRNR